MMESVDSNDAGRDLGALAQQYEAAAENLTEAFSDPQSVTVTAGEESTARATCAADGSLVELRISQGFLSRSRTGDVATTIMNAIRSAQDGLDDRVAEMASQGPQTPEQFVQQLDSITREATQRLAVIQERAEELTRRLLNNGPNQ